MLISWVSLLGQPVFWMTLSRVSQWKCSVECFDLLFLVLAQSFLYILACLGVALSCSVFVWVISLLPSLLTLRCSRSFRLYPCAFLCIPWVLLCHIRGYLSGSAFGGWRWEKPCACIGVRMSGTVSVLGSIRTRFCAQLIPTCQLPPTDWLTSLPYFGLSLVCCCLWVLSFKNILSTS